MAVSAAGHTQSTLPHSSQDSTSTA